MNYNPYAPPHAGAPDPGAPVPAGEPGVRQPWAIGEVLSAGWAGFKDNWVVLVSSFLIVGVVMSVPILLNLGYVALQRQKLDGPEAQLGSAIASLVLLPISPFFEVGLTRMWLAVARRQSPEIGVLFSGADRYLAMLGLRVILQFPALAGSFLTLAATLLGAPAAVTAAQGLTYFVGFVLAIFGALGLFYAEFFVVDAGLGPISALKSAWQMGAGERGKLLLFAGSCLAIVTGAALCCLLPMFVAYPVVFVAAALIYLRATGRAALASADPGFSYGGPPGEGYGPPPGYGPR